MRAVYLQSHKQPDSIVVGERPDPRPGHGEVRVRIAAAAFNRVDLYMFNGGAGITHELPLTLGVDGAGTVESTGEGVEGIEPGQRVVIYPARFDPMSEFSRRGDQMLCTRCRIIGEHIDGTFADYVVVPALNVFPIPDDMSFETAAVLPTAYLTAWRMIMTQAAVRPTETVLIHGVGGGASSAALQFCKIAGAWAVVTSSSDDKLEKAKQLGADEVINYAKEDVYKRVMQLTDGRGVDVVVENVGKSTWDTSMRSVVRGGRIVICGATTGGDPSADLHRIFIRQLTVVGSTLGNFDEFRDLILAAARRQFTPVIDTVYAFDRAPEALQTLDKGKQFGKFVLKVND